MDYSLQNAGSDEDWAVCFRSNDMELFQYLLYFLTPGANTEIVEIAARCIALTASSIVPSIWSEFIVDLPRAGIVVKAISCAVSRIFQLAKKAASEAARAQRRGSYAGTYVGFDLRDIADYGMLDMKEVVDKYNNEMATEYASAEELQTNILVLLMIITTALSKENRYIFAEIEFYRSENLGGIDKSTARYLGKREKDAYEFVEGLISSARVLVNLLRNVKEEVYMSCIKAIASINFQFPNRISESGLVSFTNEVMTKCDYFSIISQYFFYFLY